jgi:hypothetical protein
MSAIQHRALSSASGTSRSAPAAVDIPLPVESSRFIYNGLELDIVDRGLLSLEYADILLEKFRRIKTPRFPFVLLPGGKDANALRKEAPFLFLAVMTACHEHKSRLQHTLEREVKKWISERLIMRSEKSLDLLQGLLVHLAWHHYHFCPGQQQTTSLFQLLLSLVVDLGLNTGPQGPDQITDSDFYKSTTLKHCHSDFKGAGSTAEHRALLGCYYLSSVLALTSIPWSSL